MKRLSVAQWIGAFIAVVVGGYCVALLVDLITSEAFNSFDYVEGLELVHAIAFTAAAGVGTLACLLALVAILKRSRGLAVTAGVALLACAAAAATAEVTLALLVDKWGGNYGDRFDLPFEPVLGGVPMYIGGAFAYGTVALGLIGAVLLLKGKKKLEPVPVEAEASSFLYEEPVFEPTPAEPVIDQPTVIETAATEPDLADKIAAASEPAPVEDDAPVFAPPSSETAVPMPPPPPLAPPADPTPEPPAAPTSYFVRFDGVEYGPFDEPTMRAFVAEGRVIPSSEVRATGSQEYGPAAQISSLFP